MPLSRSPKKTTASRASKSVKPAAPVKKASAPTRSNKTRSNKKAPASKNGAKPAHATSSKSPALKKAPPKGRGVTSSPAKKPNKVKPAAKPASVKASRHLPSSKQQASKQSDPSTLRPSASPAVLLKDSAKAASASVPKKAATNTTRRTANPSPALSDASFVRSKAKLQPSPLLPADNKEIVPADFKALSPPPKDEAPMEVTDPGFLTNDDVFDETDHAQWQQLREQAAIHSRALNLNKPESHPDFDGQHCIECGEEIPPRRLELHKVRCVDCQSDLEQKDRRHHTATPSAPDPWGHPDASS